MVVAGNMMVTMLLQFFTLYFSTPTCNLNWYQHDYGDDVMVVEMNYHRHHWGWWWWYDYDIFFPERLSDKKDHLYWQSWPMFTGIWSAMQGCPTRSYPKKCSPAHIMQSYPILHIPCIPMLRYSRMVRKFLALNSASFSTLTFNWAHCTVYIQSSDVADNQFEIICQQSLTQWGLPPHLKKLRKRWSHDTTATPPLNVKTVVDHTSSEDVEQFGNKQRIGHVGLGAFFRRYDLQLNISKCKSYCLPGMKDKKLVLEWPILDLFKTRLMECC